MAQEGRKDRQWVAVRKVCKYTGKFEKRVGNRSTTKSKFAVELHSLRLFGKNVATALSWVVYAKTNSIDFRFSNTNHVMINYCQMYFFQFNFCYSAGVVCCSAVSLARERNGGCAGCSERIGNLRSGCCSLGRHSWFSSVAVEHGHHC